MSSLKVHLVASLILIGSFGVMSYVGTTLSGALHPHVAQAANENGGSNLSNNNGGTNLSNNNNSGTNLSNNNSSDSSCGSGGGQGSLSNPLKFCSIEELLTAVISILITFATPIIVLFIMYAGFLYVTARGDPKQLETARSAITWSVIGGVIVLGAWAIQTIIQNTVNSFR